MKIRAVLQTLGIVLALAAGLWALYRLERVVLVLILAVLLAYVIAPLVKLAQHSVHLAGRTRRLSRGPAIALVYLVIAGAGYGGGLVLLPRVSSQAAEIVASAPAYTRSFLAWQHGWSRYYERLRMPIEVRDSIDQSVLAVTAAAVGYARGSMLAVVGSVAYVPWLVLIPIVAAFFLKDAARFRRMLLTTLPYAERLRSHRLFEELSATLAACMRAQLLGCGIVGLLSGVGLALIGMPYAVLLGVLAGILEFIPLLGPLTLAVVAAVVGALQTPSLTFQALAFLAALRLMEDYVIYPRLLRHTVHLHPLAVILGVVAGAELDGLAGMFLAVPVVAVGSVVVRHWLGWHDDLGSDATEVTQAEGLPNGIVSAKPGSGASHAATVAG
jgi:predicted PurR-regulated permease PerM